jgi:RHS repeat-associated protein
VYSFTYSDRGRLAHVTGAAALDFFYNGLGRRVLKAGTAGGTYYVYDEAGHTLGEYSSGQPAGTETVYLGDLPVAVVTASGYYYALGDHLNAPLVLAQSDGTTVWDWRNHDPFGNNAPITSDTSLTYDHRFPGQVADSDTGLFYNYYRDYDPQTGRYIESDPIGLAAGVNTYAYVSANPLSGTDPLGLEGPNSGWSKGVTDSASSAACGDDRCKHTITIHTGGVCAPGDVMCPQAMRAAGIAPPYEYTTLTLDTVCLAKYGIGVKGTGAVAGTALGKYGPGLLARGASAAGAPAVGAYLGMSATTIAEISTGPFGIGASVLGAVSYLAKECKCPNAR